MCSLSLLHSLLAFNSLEYSLSEPERAGDYILDMVCLESGRRPGGSALVHINACPCTKLAGLHQYRGSNLRR
jgi:hypothetical protein